MSEPIYNDWSGVKCKTDICTVQSWPTEAHQCSDKELTHIFEPCWRFAVQDGVRGTLPLYRGVTDAVGSIVRHEGWRSLYAGLSPALLGAGGPSGAQAKDRAKHIVRTFCEEGTLYCQYEQYSYPRFGARSHAKRVPHQFA